MTEKFFSVYFLWKIFNPLKKGQLLFPSNRPLKIETQSSPPAPIFFENLVGVSTLYPFQKREGVHNITTSKIIKKYKPKL